MAARRIKTDYASTGYQHREHRSRKGRNNNADRNRARLRKLAIKRELERKRHKHPKSYKTYDSDGRPMRKYS